jgi:phosphoribosyl 1,2-cyclic phosphate phosphodiesterase
MSGEVIVLGSGTSNGVPMLGVRYPDGYLDNPKNHRTRASILIKGPQGNVQVDCPPEMRLQLTGQKVYDVAAVIITHTHADHIMGMDDLRSLAMKTGQAMPIFTLEEHMEDIRRVFPYAFRDPPPGLFFPRFDLRVATPTLDLVGLRIETFAVWHGTTNVLGLRVGNLAYITDVKVVSEEVKARLQGLDTLIVDGLRYAEHPNHFNLDEALGFAQELAPRQTYLTHLSHDYDHDKTNGELPKGVQLAFDGLRIVF